MSLMSWDRYYALSRLGFLTKAEIEDMSIDGRLHVLRRMDRALRRERKMGLAMHWSYCLPRHTNLLDAYRQEAEAVAALTERVAA